MDDLWIVSEDCHGDVSYWTSREAAYNEARKIISTNVDEPETEKGIRLLNGGATDREIDNYEYCVGVHSVQLNVSWA